MHTKETHSSSFTFQPRVTQTYLAKPELGYLVEGLQKGCGYLFVPVLCCTDIILQKLRFDLKVQVTQ